MSSNEYVNQKNEVLSIFTTPCHHRHGHSSVVSALSSGASLATNADIVLGAVARQTLPYVFQLTRRSCTAFEHHFVSLKTVLPLQHGRPWYSLLHRGPVFRTVLLVLTRI